MNIKQTRLRGPTACAVALMVGMHFCLAPLSAAIPPRFPARLLAQAALPGNPQRNQDEEPRVGAIRRATNGPITIRLNGGRLGRVFEGIGACSAGASSRLLIDYPEPYRSQILDYLFKPNYGAGFQHLKVEVGGDINSTDGCEPSHMRTRDDKNVQRGYEWWLMKEAKRRNSEVMLDCLQWGAPAWIGNGHFYSQDNADYLVEFLKGAKDVHGLTIDFVGLWNETRYDTGWLKQFRKTLNQRGFSSVKIVAGDEINSWSIADVMQTDPELAEAIAVMGTHYPKFKSTPAAQRCGKPIWSTEDGPWRGDWDGARQLARMYNRNYVEGKMTKTIIWSPVTSYYDILPLPSSGVMRANEPWSGHYEVQPALWVTAHTTQFAKPGWIYLAGEGCGYLPEGGSYVTLKSTNHLDYSIIVETIGAFTPQTVTFLLEGGLTTNMVHVWGTGRFDQFMQLPDLRLARGAFTIQFHPGCIYSLTSTTGQRKGDATAPEAGRFPTRYIEDFDRYEAGATPRYFSDQAGIFEVVARQDGTGKSLRQVIDRKGIEWHLHLNPYPETFLGDPAWQDYEVSVDALIEQEGFVSLFGRVGLIRQNAAMPEGYWLKVSDNGYWELGTAASPLASGKAGVQANQWHQLKLRFEGSITRVFIDRKLMGSVTNQAYTFGMVGVGSGWHGAQFDNLRIESALAD
jgi:galactosylceramidase